MGRLREVNDRIIDYWREINEEFRSPEVMTETRNLPERVLIGQIFKTSF